MNSNKYRFRSKIDWWLWLLFIVVCSVMAIVALDIYPVWLGILYLGLTIGLFVVGIFGVWYDVEGNELTVYNLFYPMRMPIDKIESIRYCKGYIAGPASSTKRLSIKFTDRKVFKSSMPIEISPADRDGFVDLLCRINPSIKVIKH